MKDKYLVIDLSLIDPSPTNPRKTFDETALQDLVTSIKEKGVIQPILVRQGSAHYGTKDEARYEIIAGERRFRAALDAGLKGIPAIVTNLDDEAVLEVQVIENLQRSDLHPLEEAQGYFQLSRKPGQDVSKIADRIGRSAAYVYDRLKLLSLTKDAQALFLANKFTTAHAVLLARLSPSDQARAIDPQQRALLDYDLDHYLYDGEDKTAVKPRSIREFQAWIENHVKFNREEVDTMLFPETASTLKAAQEQAEKIIPITHDHYVQPEARADEKIVRPGSWKRADGEDDSKTCEHSVMGVFVIGRGRGQTLRVCIAKEKCKVHWAQWQKERGQRGKVTAGMSDKEKAKAQAAEQKRVEAERVKKERIARWEKATPAILKAVEAAVKKTKVSATGVLADLVFDEIAGYRFKQNKDLNRGRTAEDLVRYLATLILREKVEDWDAENSFPKIAVLLGVDVWKVVDEAVPHVAAKAAKKEKPSKKVKVERGVCRVCGCTEEAACEGGCAWADKTKTICTSCQE